MSDAEPTLQPIVISQVMVNFATGLGVDKDTVLQGTGIPSDALSDGEALISRAQNMRLVENLILALPDTPALGFKLGLHYDVATFGIWGFALRTCHTLRHAVATAFRYLPLSTAYCRMYAFEEDGRFGIGLDPQAIPSHLRQFLLERDLATSLNLLHEISLRGLTVCAAEFQGPPPPYSGFIAEHLGVTPQYHSDRNAVQIPIKAVDSPLPTFNARLVRMLEDQCKAQLQQRQTGGIAGLVRQQLLGPLGLVATLEEVAKALAMSPRSLRRKLEKEGTRFRTLVEDERRDTATAMLSGSDMKQDELAIHLGYTDTASFNRAFRRWMAMSPGEYRRRKTLP